MDRPDSTLSRAFSALVLVAAVAVTGVLVATSQVPSWGAVALFVVLTVLADRVEIEFESGTTLTPTFMLFAAAVVVFVSRGEYAGALVVALVSQPLDFHWWQHRKWAKLAFNTGMLVFCAGAATGLVAALPSTFLSEPLGLVLVGCLAGLGLAVTNVTLVAIVDFLADRRSASALLTELAPYFVSEVPFAVVGAFAGMLYLHVGPIMVPLLVAPILFAHQAVASYLMLRETQESATNTLIRALESKDSYTAGHVERVARYAEYIGRELQFTPGRLERLRLAALMHDIGKLIVPNELLNKPGKLTEDEFAIVRRHEQVSMELLREIDFLAPVAPSASSEFTHYRADDPKHPIEPYIVHVADAYDAMTSTRSYRKALSQGVAFAELRDKSGTQFHPVAVEALISAIRARGEEHGRGHEDEQHLWAVPPPEAGTGSAGLGDLAGGEP